MTSTLKIKKLGNILEKANNVTTEDFEDANFISLINITEKNLTEIYGENSTQLSHFRNLQFSDIDAVYSINFDSHDNAKDKQCFHRDLGILKSSISDYILDIKEEIEDNANTSIEESIEKPISKIFISHASKDSEVVDEIIEILETIGVRHNQIFCTSFAGYGIDLGKNFLDSIKEELSSDSLVIFLLSNNFYASPVCLCEMGATWVLAKEHIPILLPPFGYQDVQGVIPLTQGFKINESDKLNLFKEKIEKVFDIQETLDPTTWERKRDKIMKRIEKSIEDIK